MTLLSPLSIRTLPLLPEIGTSVSYSMLTIVRTLKERGVEFVDSSKLHPDDRGALTRKDMGGLAFELVHVSD